MAATARSVWRSPIRPRPDDWGRNQFEATCKCNFAKNYPYAIGPRLGVAYQINAKTVLRGGFGVVYNATCYRAGSSANTCFHQRASGQLRPDHRPVQGRHAGQRPAEVALL